MTEQHRVRDGHVPTTCGCGPAWQRPKPNGTCATCGGWLPGEKPAPLSWATSLVANTDDVDCVETS